MANSLSGEAKYFDTAGATSAVNTPVRIKTFVWSGGANADTLVLKNRIDGDTILSLTANTGQLTIVVSFPQAVMFDGLYLTTLGGGILISYS